MASPPFISIPAHGPGLTTIAFLPDGLSLLTGGPDCIVRKWSIHLGIEHEPDLALEAEGPITSVTSSSKTWISTSTDTSARRYDQTSMDMAGVVTAANGLAVRCAIIDPTERWVAVTSDEPAVKVIDLHDVTSITLLEGHTRSVRKATWHPSEPILTTCCSDGVIIAWDLSIANQARILQKIEGIIPVEKDDHAVSFTYDCSAIWHPSGQYFFIVNKAHELITVSRDTWSKISSFEDPETNGAITALAVSINGTYVASASNKKVHVWSTQTRRRLFNIKAPVDTIVNQLAFSPTENLLTWSDSDGALNMWRNFVTDDFPSPVSSAKPSRQKATAVPTDLDLFGENIPVGDDDVDLDAGAGEDDWIDDDLGVLGGRAQETQAAAPSSRYVKEMVSITKAQPPFQPGATPMSNKRRYLAYNMIGTIEVTDQDTHNVVNVEFFDQTHSKGYHFTDHNKYELGYLGQCGALFACQPEGDHSAQLMFRPHARWNSQAEWTYKLGRPDSRILSIAAGGSAKAGSSNTSAGDDIYGLGNVVVATSEGDLTFLSGTGRERRILGLGADLVTMVASVDWVFVVHRAGSTTIDGSQNLTYSLFNFEDFSVRQRGVLPLRKGQTLSWAGISEEGAPVIYDSEGYLHMLTKYQLPHHASWCRVMDTDQLERKKGKDETYWPVGFGASGFMCVILKGLQRYPGFPRPLIQDIPVQLSFRKDNMAEERLERELLFVDLDRDALGEELTTNAINQRETSIDKELIQLIQQACKADNSARVVELSHLLHHRKSLEATIKLAEFYHLVGLKEKLQALLYDREAQEDRLEAARDKRISWNRLDKPVRRMEDRITGSYNYKAFQDFGPPPSIHRPGLAPAKPNTIQASYLTETYTQSSSMPAATSPPDSPSSQTQDGKRKRDLQDDGEGVKRRNVMGDSSVPPPVKKANPFARKPAQGGKNPFGKKHDPSSGTVQKTESFFEKVDAAESGAKQGKVKRKQSQLTDLFRGKDKGNGGTAKEANAQDSPSQTETVIETQPTDENGDVSIPESNEDVDPPGSPEWNVDETVDETADAEIQQDTSQI